jgi:hypothetical protein
MKKLQKSFILAFLFALICLPSLRAQTATGTPVDTNAPAAQTTLTGQAPDDVTKKITDLVHTGKYAEAQQLTTGLLVAYPNDQRLIKAKTLLDKLLAHAGSANATPGSNEPASNGASAQPGTDTNAEQLTGMEKVDYNALIELARQAQQTTDLSQQATLLRQFMDQSGLFLQKHPDDMLLWQLRAASAISLNEPMEGYTAGQKLITAGAVDSNDPNLQRLLAQLKNKGWLDKQGVEQSKQKIEEDKKYGWLLGNWNVAFSYFSKATFDYGMKQGSNQVEFSKSGSSVEGYVTAGGRKFQKPAYKYTVRNSDEVTLSTNWEVSPNPPRWEPITSISFGSDMKTMTIILKRNTYVFTKVADSQSQ